MELKMLDGKFRDSVNQFIKDEWGGPLSVARCILTDTSSLPGYVFVEGNVLKGGILYHIVGDACEIAILFSLDEAKGVGTGLINAVIDTARQKKCGRVWLITTNDNTHAIRFYQRRNFSLKAVHIDSMEESRKLKPQIPLTGIDGIPIKHEFEFEYTL